MRTLCFLAAVALTACPCPGDSVERLQVDNQTYSPVYLSRLGAPSFSVLIPKRMIGRFEVPLVGSGTPALETLLISFPDNVTVPESEFRGFNGQYAQAARIVIVSPQNILITYESGNSASHLSPLAGTNSASRDYYGSANAGGYPIGSAGGSNRRPEEFALGSASAEELAPPKAQIRFPDKAGAKVRVASPDSRNKLVEAPAPISSLAKEVSQTAPPARPISAPSPVAKDGSGSLITWAVICLGLTGFVIWKRLSSG